MSNWRKFGNYIFNIDLIEICWVQAVSSSISRIFYHSKAGKTDFIPKLEFKTEKEALEYLINAIKEDICQ